MARKKRRKPPAIVPRLGPPKNVRPGGVHESIKRYNRKRHKAALRREEDEGGFVVCGRVLRDELALDQNRSRVDQVLVEAELLGRYPECKRHQLRQMERRQVGASPARGRVGLVSIER